MARRYRRGFSATEKTEMWDRWQRGESLRSIGRVFGKPSSSIYFQLAPHGGIRPAPRRRSRLALTLSEREEISRGIVAQRSIRSMARLLGRSPSRLAVKFAAMAAMITTGQRRLMPRPGSAPAARSVVSWRTVRGYAAPCHGSLG